MTEEEIKTIIRLTVKELRREGLLRDLDDVIYAEMSERLTRFFEGKPDIDLGRALQAISSDWYFEIIPLYYQNGMSTEAISRHIGADISTINRNKKRLCIKLYSLIE